METMRDFLEQIRKRYNIESERQMAMTIGISPQALHQHKTTRTKHFSEPVAYNIAKLLNLNPAYVLLCLRVEAAENRSTKAVWLEMLHKVERYAAAVLLVTGLALPFQPIPAKADCTGSMYIMSNRRRYWIRVVRRWFFPVSGIPLAA